MYAQSGHSSITALLLPASLVRAKKRVRVFVYFFRGGTGFRVSGCWADRHHWTSYAMSVEMS